KLFAEKVTLHDIEHPLPYSARSFDAVILASQVLQYVDNKPQVISEIKRVLKNQSFGFIHDMVGFSIVDQMRRPITLAKFFAKLNRGVVEYIYERWEVRDSVIHTVMIRNNAARSLP